MSDTRTARTGGRILVDALRIHGVDRPFHLRRLIVEVDLTAFGPDQPLGSSKPLMDPAHVVGEHATVAVNHQRRL